MNNIGRITFDGSAGAIVQCSKCGQSRFTAEHQCPPLTEADVRRIINEELGRFQQEHYKLFGVLRDGD